MCAAKNGTGTMQALLTHGADPNYVPSGGRSCGTDSGGENPTAPNNPNVPAMYAASENGFAGALQLLHIFGGLPRTQFEGWTCAEICRHNGHAALHSMLVAMCAMPSGLLSVAWWRHAALGAAALRHGRLDPDADLTVSKDVALAIKLARARSTPSRHPQDAEAEPRRAGGGGGGDRFDRVYTADIATRGAEDIDGGIVLLSERVMVDVGLGEGRRETLAPLPAKPFCRATLSLVMAATRGWSPHWHWLHHGGVRDIVHEVLLVAQRMQAIAYQHEYTASVRGDAGGQGDGGGGGKVCNDDGTSSTENTTVSLPPELWLKWMGFLQRSWWQAP